MNKSFCFFFQKEDLSFVPFEKGTKKLLFMCELIEAGTAMQFFMRLIR
jgi:hypothetical protein